MESAIKKIIEIEHEAQNLLVQGYDQREKIQLSTLEQLKNMEENIGKMTDQKVNELEEKSRRETDERLAKIKEDTENKIKILEEYVEKNRESWENQIFARIIGR
ncbi:MAG: hypothetical protein GX227_07555 [Clostridiaceae bacterium]|nr:hypothetical protein [Clostridiaceae bacterium]